jgi:hypothetical protein
MTRHEPGRQAGCPRIRPLRLSQQKRVRTSDQESVETELGVSHLVICPSCGSQEPYAGPAGDGSDTMSECPGCDIYFEAAPHRSSFSPCFVQR